MNGRDRIADAFDEHTRAVRWSDDGTTVVVWSGGVNYNVYSVLDAGRSARVQAATTFSISDDKGRPYDRDDAITAMESFLDNY